MADGTAALRLLFPAHDGSASHRAAALALGWQCAKIARRGPTRHTEGLHKQYVLTLGVRKEGRARAHHVLVHNCEVDDIMEDAIEGCVMVQERPPCGVCMRPVEASESCSNLLVLRLRSPGHDAALQKMLADVQGVCLHHVQVQLRRGDIQLLLCMLAHRDPGARVGGPDRVASSACRGCSVKMDRRLTRGKVLPLRRPCSSMRGTGDSASLESQSKVFCHSST